MQAGGENRQGAGADAPAYALETLQLTDFRNYRRLSLEVSHAPVAQLDSASVFGTEG